VNRCWEDQDVDEKVIFNCVSKKYSVKVQAGLNWLRFSSVTDVYEPSRDRRKCSSILQSVVCRNLDGRIILRWIFRKWEGVVGTGQSGFRIGTGGGHL
jgi:hypothetical protein